jgi:hypothetical protein
MGHAVERMLISRNDDFPSRAGSCCSWLAPLCALFSCS